MRERWLLLLTAVYVIALAIIGLWSTPVDQNVAVAELPPVELLARLLNLTASQSYGLVESVSNVALFVPLGALVLLWWREWGWMRAAGVAFASSLTIEILQAIVRPARVAAIADIAANTVGGAIGGLLVVGGRELVRRRRRR